jgi:hypothetical protein
MNTSIDFQVVCDNCGSLAIRIENPERASREAIVYCGDCEAPRGTVGALRDLAVRPDALVLLPAKQRTSKPIFRSELAEKYNELQKLRRKVQLAELAQKEMSPRAHAKHAIDNPVIRGFPLSQ